MRLPRLTAEYAIGPATCTYFYAAASGQAPAGPAGRQSLSPQQMFAVRGGDPEIDQAARMLLEMKRNPCEPDQIYCRGLGIRSGEWTCCDPDTECTRWGNGQPFCRPKNAQQT